MAARAESVVTLSDSDDEPVDLLKTEFPELTSLGSPSRKRKVDIEVIDKVYLTDDSEGPVKKPKKKRAKRKSTAKSKQRQSNGDERPPEDEEDPLEGLPEYLRARRRAFEDRQEKNQDFHDHGLMIPPDYSDIDALADVGLANLEERPKFDAQSGVQPRQPYKDVELPQSGGFIPASIAQYLRDYQIEGVKFLHQKFVYQEGGILGDDMGLGKTVQVAAFLTVAFGKTGDERDAKRMREIRFHSDRWYPRILIICPGSLIMNWRNELQRWGWWHVDVYHGAGKDDVLTTAKSGLLEIMITTYDTYKNSRSAVNMVQWDAVVADECHRLKDGAAQTTKAMKEVNALCRIGLTGTAIQNNYMELWTLLDWTNSGQLGPPWEWKDQVATPLIRGQAHDATAYELHGARDTAQKLVRNLLPRYFLRRLKSLIADQLPKKTDRVAFCPLTRLQLEAYTTFLESDEMQLVRKAHEPCECGGGLTSGGCHGKRLPNGKNWQSAVFPGMVTLQKLANHLTLLTPQGADIDEKHENELTRLKQALPDTWEELYTHRDQIRYLVHPEYCGKWKVLKKLLAHWETSGDKVLVFSHSVRLLRILQHLFAMTHYAHSYLDGSLSYEQRQKVVDDFNSDPSQFVFLISTKAGGVGLNITAANKVVIMDPHWNPSYDLQAQDRAYRIGQTRDVEVYRLISVGTVEEIVYGRQIYKQQQANIAYAATTERRYFKGVQQDPSRKGEIFGLSNIFTYHSESGLLQDIVNKTNVAEARAGVNLINVDMDKAAQDGDLGEIDEDLKDDEDGTQGAQQLADLLTGKAKAKDRGKRKSETSIEGGNAVSAILSLAGVSYTHDNAEVIGSSKIEEQLSKEAARLATSGDAAITGRLQLFQGSQEQGGDGYEYNPPEDVQLRQFCSMAKEMGFDGVAEFAFVVEGWTQEKRRLCLQKFYRMVEEKEKAERDARETASEGESEEEVKHVIKSEIKAEVKNEDKARIQNEVKKEVKREVKREVKDEQSVKRDDDAEMKIDGDVKAKTDVDAKLSIEDIKTKAGLEFEDVKPNKSSRSPSIKEEMKFKVEADVKVTKKEEDPDEVKKEEDVKPKLERDINQEQDVKAAIARSLKRTSIFLSDDEDDDEL